VPVGRGGARPRPKILRGADGRSGQPRWARDCAGDRRAATKRPRSRRGGPLFHQDKVARTARNWGKETTLQGTLLAGAAIAVGSAGAAHAEELTVKVGTVRSIPTVAILWAAEKGYFKEFGIKVVNENLDTAANSIALLAQNQLQMVEGGISAGYFNALEK